MLGKVKFFNSQLGFGLINAEDGQEYSVHESEIEDMVDENDTVEFNPEGIEAYGVRKAMT